ncbi:MAG: hypothetical protein H6R10_977 [Rhodocyclaceae bacterium]|nr:hypothetical protein [Rhodocyclaceae bacterium]
MRIERSARAAGSAAHRRTFGVVALAIATLAVPPAAFAAPAKALASAAPIGSPGAAIGEPLHLVIGKSTLLRLPTAVERVSVGNPAVADVTVISPRELYFLGKVFGSTNVILWSRGGTTIMDVFVDPDTALLQDRLRELLPGEKEIKVSVAADSIVLSGLVSSAPRAAQAVEVAEAYVAQINRGLLMPSVAGDKVVAAGTAINVAQAPVAGGRARVVNMMKVADPQQVMLEVKVAEVQKTLLDKLGVQFNASLTRGSFATSILTNFLTNSAGVLTAAVTRGNFSYGATLDAAKKDGLIKVLAEPNIVAISGQEASFLAGGKVFIPVASQPNALTGVVTVTLEEKEFGVGLKFTPTVLEGGRISLRVAPEVSELSQTGTPFTTVNGVTSVLPSMTTRRTQTTVQLNDGQSLAIAGLIRSNVSETINRFPGLGEVPILGALFRSNEFQTEQTELMFVITPRLVKPLPPNYALPTDSFVPPSRAGFFLNGQMEGHPDTGEQPAEGSAGAPAPAAATQENPAARPGGFEVK